MERDSKIYVAGGTGMVGSAIIRSLLASGYTNLLSNYHKRNPTVSSSHDLNLNLNLCRFLHLDLEIQKDVNSFFEKERPEYVFLAAAKVGGIYANNTYPADFIYNNLIIEANVIHAAYKYGVKKLLFLGSSCIYPRLAPQPMKEEYLLTGELEPTNEPYAIAKIAGIKLCQSYNRQHGTNFISVMPTNLYGPNDNYDPLNSHVLPALMRRFHEANERRLPFVEVWGTGKPRREFMYSEDMADACVFIMSLNKDTLTSTSASPIVSSLNPPTAIINIGTGEDVTIQELAEKVLEVVGYRGELRWDTSKPDGAPRKLLDVSVLRSLGWKYRTSLYEGLRLTYKDFLNKFA
jgi:GDP-L-fucose synthase